MKTIFIALTLASLSAPMVGNAQTAPAEGMDAAAVLASEYGQSIQAACLIDADQCLAAVETAMAAMPGDWSADLSNAFLAQVSPYVLAGLQGASNPDFALYAAVFREIANASTDVTQQIAFLELASAVQAGDLSALGQFLPGQLPSSASPT